MSNETLIFIGSLEAGKSAAEMGAYSPVFGALNPERREQVPPVFPKRCKTGTFHGRSLINSANKHQIPFLVSDLVSPLESVDSVLFRGSI